MQSIQRPPNFGANLGGLSMRRLGGNVLAADSFDYPEPYVRGLWGIKPTMTMDGMRKKVIEHAERTLAL